MNGDKRTQLKINFLGISIPAAKCGLVLLSLCWLLFHSSMAAQQEYREGNLKWNDDLPFERVFRAQYNGELAENAFYGSGNNLTVDFGDLDADGDLDLVQGTKKRLEWLRNSGSESNPYWAPLDWGNLIEHRMGYWTPALVDIDADGDLDLFCGFSGWTGSISFWENIGTADNPVWGAESQNWGGITTAYLPTPTFCDIDNDGDQDLFIGDKDGVIHYYRNKGNATTAIFEEIAGSYAVTGITDAVAPEFVDIDGDSDYDLFVGREYGTILFYRNNGNPSSAEWTLESSQYLGISMGQSELKLNFADIDGDSDEDLFMTDLNGSFAHYQNDGAAPTPGWNKMTSQFRYIMDFGRNSAPTAGDIDGDSDIDVLVGTDNIYILRNVGFPQIPEWEWEGAIAVSVPETWLVPELADIDGDDDLDLFVGTLQGNIHYFANDGTPTSPDWNQVNSNYMDFNFGFDSHPSVSFADIDADGDLDMFVLHWHYPVDSLAFYLNAGTSNLPQWVLMDDNYMNLGSYDLGYGSCDFGDSDKDGDLDCIFGEIDGNIYCFENIGTAQTPAWNYKGCYEELRIEGITRYSIPIFTDLNGDSELDILSGLAGGGLNLWWNTTHTLPTVHRVPADFETLIEAMAAADSGDYILVAPGTYEGSFEMRPGVILRSESGPMETIITGNGVRNLIMGAQNAVIHGFTIADNYNGMSEAGNGIYSDGDNMIICRCIIRNHRIGIYLDHNSRALVYNNTIDNNHSHGILMQIEPSPEIFNNIITNNGETGIHRNTAHSLGSPNVQYNAYHENPVNFGYYGDPWTPDPGTDELFVDPLFVGGTPFDYHLTENSPCIDAGDPNQNNDPDGTRADMGALYYDQSTGIDFEPVSNLPSENILYPAYPNPFNPITRIRFDVRESCRVVLIIHNLLGQAVRPLVDAPYQPGRYEIVFNAAGLSSGLYFYHIQMGDFQSMGKMILLE